MSGTDSHSFLIWLQITLLHFILIACFMSFLDTGIGGFSSFPSSSFLAFGSVVSLAITVKSENECDWE